MLSLDALSLINLLKKLFFFSNISAAEVMSTKQFHFASPAINFNFNEKKKTRIEIKNIKHESSFFT